MLREPCGPRRPLVVLGGWRTVHATAAALGRTLGHLTIGDAGWAEAVSFLTVGRLEHAAAKAVAAVEARWPSDERDATSEVDVVGVSMGGIVARVAAAGLHAGAPGAVGKRLRIARLFTLATPHRGARAAGLFPLDTSERQMMPGSEMLRRLDSLLPTLPYELRAYARLRDGMVGATRAAPTGRGCFWVDGPLLLSHLTITRERRFIVDIARALRGESSLAARESDPPSN